MSTETYPTVTCCMCDRVQVASYADETRDQMVARSLCFTCNFWTEIVNRPDRSNCAVIYGHHYAICPESSNKRSSGFGGTPFVIRFNDGRTVETTNLWHQGEIPPHFRDVLPDNATRAERKQPWLTASPT